MQRICYNCGTKFETEDKSATMCDNCIKLYKTPKPIEVTVYPKISKWKIIERIIVGSLGIGFALFIYLVFFLGVM